MNGKFIVFEGGEGCGKTTMLEMSTKWLTEIKYPFVAVKSPGGTSLGEQIKSLIYGNKCTPEAEVLLFAADYAQTIKEIIEPALEQGKAVLCDRFYYSTIAYQGFGRGIALDQLHPVIDLATNNLEPDLALWLDIDPELGIRRKSQQDINRFEREDLTFHQNVRLGYSYLERNYRKFTRIDASDSERKVFSKVQAHLRSLLLSHY